MGIILKRILSFVFPAVLFVLAGVRLTLDLIGWSTAPDDVDVAKDRAVLILNWVASLPSWLPLTAASVLTAWLMYMSWPGHFAEQTVGGPGRSHKRKPPVASNTWAQGLKALTIRDAACAFAGIDPTQWGDSTRAQAIAVDLLSQTSNGYIGTPEDLAANMGRLSGGIVGAPHYEPKPAVSIDTIVAVKCLVDFALERPVNVDWLVRGGSKVIASHRVEALEQKRSRELSTR